MPIAHPPSESDPDRPGIPVNPVFARDPARIPRLTPPGEGLDPDAAHQAGDDLRRVLPGLSAQPGPQRGAESASFAHGAGRPAGDERRHAR